MTALDDLNTALGKLTTAVSDGVAEIQAETQKILDLVAAGSSGVDPAAVSAAASNIGALADSLEAAVSAAKSALPSAPPAPPPGP